MRECLWLVHNGIPFDVSFSLDGVRRTAWCIMFSEMQGNKFDWDGLRWQDE